MKLAATSQVAGWLFVLGGVMLILLPPWVGAYALVLGTLLSFASGGASMPGCC